MMTSMEDCMMQCPFPHTGIRGQSKLQQETPAPRAGKEIIYESHGGKASGEGPCPGGIGSHSRS